MMNQVTLKTFMLSLRTDLATRVDNPLKRKYAWFHHLSCTTTLLQVSPFWVTAHKENHSGCLEARATPDPYTQTVWYKPPPA